MSNSSEREDFTSAHPSSGATAFPLSGLVPSRYRTEHSGAAFARADHGRHLAPKPAGRAARNVLATMPVLLVGSLALATLNLTGTPQAAPTKRPPGTDSNTADLSGIRNAIAAAATRPSEPPVAQTPVANLATASVPAKYTVRHGDTVSGIAGRYHLSTASVLALNGLSWKSLIFPGQVLRLTKGSASSSTHKPAQHPATPKPTTPATTTPTQSAPQHTTTTSTKYTIRSGDTVTAIAHRFGVTVHAVLKANGLTASSIIYAGRTLIIPGVTSGTTSTPTSTQPAQVGDSITPLSPEMKTNASTIISVGKKLGVPDYGIIIALAAAAQESGLRNLSGGDLDSLGLFQQRPSAGWGTRKQLEDTTHASELFFGGPSNPNKGKTRGLLDIKGWQSMSVTKAAQAVQISAHPNAYAKWEASARAWYSALG